MLMEKRQCVVFVHLCFFFLCMCYGRRCITHVLKLVPHLVFTFSLVYHCDCRGGGGGGGGDDDVTSFYVGITFLVPRSEPKSKSAG